MRREHFDFKEQCVLNHVSAARVIAISRGYTVLIHNTLGAAYQHDKDYWHVVVCPDFNSVIDGSVLEASAAVFHSLGIVILKTKVVGNFSLTRCWLLKLIKLLKSIKLKAILTGGCIHKVVCYSIMYAGDLKPVEHMLLKILALRLSKIALLVGWSFQTSVTELTRDAVVVSYYGFPAGDTGHFRLPLVCGPLTDPYVKVWLCQGEKRVEKRKTKVLKCHLNPVYEENFEFNVSHALLRNTSLVVSVMDYDTVGRNELIGKVILATKSGPAEAKHWNEMNANPGTDVTFWHQLMS
ncbi:Synaptotagmin-7 [Nymphon striatum]|nr:Synaptotagmin-7 [Nymphon striatum]